MLKFFRATMEGPTFTFEAFGRTELEAATLLMKAMHKHGKEYDLKPGWFNDMDTSCVEVQIGSAYRDGEKLL